MFSNPGDTLIAAFAGTHTTSIAALVENRNVIAIEADQSQWLSAQNHVKEVVNSILTSLPYKPSTNVQAERFHRIKGMVISQQLLEAPQQPPR